MKTYALLNGKILPLTEIKISPNDHGFLYGDGCYEALRTINGKMFDLKTHLERLRNSAKILQIDLPYSNEEIENWIKELLMKNQISFRDTVHCVSTKGDLGDFDQRIRITLTRGENHFNFEGSKNPTLLITTTPLKNYEEEYTNGISVTTIELSRILPEVKTISMLPTVLAKQKAKSENCFECLFIENGYITEGGTSNVILKNGNEIWITPKEKALPGTAQKKFIQQTVGHAPLLRIIEKNFTIEDLKKSEVAMIINSIFGILEITEVCGIRRDILPYVSSDFVKEIRKKKFYQ